MAKRQSAKDVVLAKRPDARLVKTPIEGGEIVYQIIDRGLNISGNHCSAGSAWAQARHSLPYQPQIAAAPDLLEACRSAKALLINHFNEPERTVFWQLVAAIARAEASSPEAS